MKQGQRIYYTGDMANKSGYGSVTAVDGSRYTVKLDDGRQFKGLYAIQFQPSAGQRFKTIEQCEQEKQEQLNQWNAFVAKQKASK